MDPNHDNPIIRFTAFWWGLGVFLIFALLLAVVTIANRDQSKTLEDVVAKKRYETKVTVEKAQAAALPQAAIDAAISKVAQDLAASKPAAVETPAQVVPGSETAKRLAAVAAEVPIDPAVMAAGKAQFLICAACHGQNGEGTALAPPLAGSEWVKGPVSNLIRIQLRGLEGPIKVAGKDYNIVGGMAALNYQTDEQIAAVLTYVRNSFGNKAPAVSPDEVKALRSEVGKPKVTAAELIQP